MFCSEAVHVGWKSRPLLYQNDLDSSSKMARLHFYLHNFKQQTFWQFDFREQNLSVNFKKSFREGNCCDTLSCSVCLGEILFPVNFAAAFYLCLFNCDEWQAGQIFHFLSLSKYLQSQDKFTGDWTISRDLVVRTIGHWQWALKTGWRHHSIRSEYALSILTALSEQDDIGYSPGTLLIWWCARGIPIYSPLYFLFLGTWEDYIFELPYN